MPQNALPAGEQLYLTLLVFEQDEHGCRALTDERAVRTSPVLLYLTAHI